MKSIRERCEERQAKHRYPEDVNHSEYNRGCICAALEALREDAARIADEFLDNDGLPRGIAPAIRERFQ